MLRVCTRLLQSGGMPTGSHVGGGRVASIGKYAGSAKKVIKPSITDNKINEDAIQIKMSTLLAKEINYSTEIEPPLPRKWMRAPLSSLSTATTRRDWFRFMSFNMMTDRWGKTHPTTPVCGAKVRVPSFTRQDPTSIDADAFVDYDETLGDELPHFLEPSFRREHLVRLLRSYDPDVVCLNEVNRTFFNDEMWKYVRFLGYGNMYQSSRGSGVKALRKGDDPAAPRNAGKIAEEEDIGNVILFHKGRFVPILIHGVDLGRSFHFAHFTSLRDKVTNLNLVIACVQFTAGDTSAAVETRLHEAKQTLRILEGMQKNDADRSHMSAVICGDLNNQSDDEPCVEVLRERFSPRTTWWEDPDGRAGTTRTTSPARGTTSTLETITRA
ncbi:hypothetical protein AGDE_08872 [Angomonas deanei]|nr:hypothetical protein AGDE_08872 [Angomonas deanei]|eukprot:EPY32087.1 hypothetical protein AGDE_08872 [Angomonas deanei]